MQPPATIPGPVLGSEGQACARCAAPLAVDQRYCLNCGTRRTDMRLAFLELASTPAVPGGPGAVVPARDGDATRSPLVALGALIALLLALGIGVLLGRGGNDPAPAAAGPPAIVTVAAPAAAATTAPAAFVSDWPAGTTGFTVTLRALPGTATAGEVAQAKQQATSQGASAVGALRSDEYPSLPPGQIVVYSGTFTARAAAQSALKGLRASFAQAKVTRVAATASGGTPGSAGASPGTTTTPRSSGLSTKEYEQRSKKIPDEVQSQGTPPPADGAAPGDGGNATEIG